MDLYWKTGDVTEKEDDFVSTSFSRLGSALRWACNELPTSGSKFGWHCNNIAERGRIQTTDPNLVLQKLGLVFARI